VIIQTEIDLAGTGIRFEDRAKVDDEDDHQYQMHNEECEVVLSEAIDLSPFTHLIASKRLVQKDGDFLNQEDITVHTFSINMIILMVDDVISTIRLERTSYYARIFVPNRVNLMGFDIHYESQNDVLLMWFQSEFPSYQAFRLLEIDTEDFVHQLHKAILCNPFESILCDK